MPVVYILAGSNGTGKTTFYALALQNNFFKKGLSFINVDIIAQSLGGYNVINYANASEIYSKSVKLLIDAKEDFMIESNLADNRSYDWIESMKKNGYDVVLYYLSTDVVLIS
jgi:predicted ABC-type ATPase